MALKTVSYAARNVFLKRLGFRSYRAYLKSDLWSDIRSDLLSYWRERTGGFVVYCYAGCGKHYKDWHHRTYTESVLAGQGTRKRVVPLCRGCHNGIEYHPNGAKRSPDAVDAELARIRRSRRAYWKEKGNPGMCPTQKRSSAERPLRPSAGDISGCP